jgi:hypothetical protein
MTLLIVFIKEIVGNGEELKQSQLLEFQMDQRLLPMPVGQMAWETTVHLL